MPEKKHVTEIKHDVTIMTSSGHVTSSGACTIDCPYASLYRLSVETIPQSNLVSEIFSSKVATMIISDDVISDVIRPGSTMREEHIDAAYWGNIVLKYRPILARIAGEEAF